MAKFNQLTEKSINTLKPHITYWLLDKDAFDLNLDINDKLEIQMARYLKYIGEYAITYAVLLDDKDLAEDLCRNGANLEVRDRRNSNKTPLELALAYGRAGIINIFVRYNVTLPHNDLLIPSAHPCCKPFTFFWTIQEKISGREADYTKTKKLMNSP